MPGRPFEQKSTARSRRAAERRAAQIRAAYDEEVRLNKQTLQDPSLLSSPVEVGPKKNSRPSLASLASKPLEAAISKTAKTQTPPTSKPSSPRPSPSSKIKKKTEVAAQDTSSERKEANPQRRLAFYVFILTLALLATLLFGAPIFGQETNILNLVIGGAVSLIALERTFYWFKKANNKAKLLSVVLPGVIFLFFGLGLTNQVVIEGKAYPAWSETAKAYQVAEDMYSDLLILWDNDKYLAMETTQARTHTSDIEKASTAASDIADRWNPTIFTEAPSDAFITAARDINASAVAQTQALDLLGENLLQEDSARTNTINQDRAAAVESFINATTTLRQASSPFGFDPIVSEGPVE